MIHIPPEVQAAAGVSAAQALQCSFSGFCHAIRREHFTQTQLVRRQLFVAEHAIGMTEDRAVFRAERLCNFIQRKQLLLVQPLRLLYALHFVF